MAYGIIPDQGSNPCLLHWQVDSLPLNHLGSPKQRFLKSYRLWLFLWEACLLSSLCQHSRSRIPGLFFSRRGSNFFMNGIKQAIYSHIVLASFIKRSICSPEIYNNISPIANAHIFRGRSPGEGVPTPVFWPGEFHGLYSPWGRKESDSTGQLSHYCGTLSYVHFIYFYTLSQ